MKQEILLVLLLGVFNFIQAQHINTTSTQYSGNIYHLGGNVGIGTTTPDRLLTLEGASGTYLNLKSNNGEHEILMGADAGGGIISTMSNHDLQIRAGGNSTKVIVKADGNIGIGTISPSARLDVLGVSKIRGGGNTLRLYGDQSTTATHAYISFNDQSASQSGVIGYTDPGVNHMYFWNKKGHIGFINGPTGSNSLNMYIMDNGNVGIGSSNPDRKLTVNGDIKSHGLMVRDDGATDLWMYRDADVGDWSLLRSNKGNGIALIGQVDVVALAVSRATSNVLIGKTSQSNTSYKLDVAGKVRANEIVVNTTGADYVFDEDYQLKTLSEVETYIQENGHLPDIPSAKEMQKEGMAVGELNTKLLEKIEELTLYMLDQNKAIISLQEDLSDVKNELKTLKERK